MTWGSSKTVSALTVALLLTLGSGLPSCSKEDQSAAFIQQIDIPTPAGLFWQAEGQHSVATLGASTISLGALKAVMVGLDIKEPRVALLQMARADTVAARALNQRDRAIRPASIQRYHQALVQRYLKQKLEGELQAETVPKEYIKVAYQRMRPYFDHHDAYYIMDFLLLCCRKSAHSCAEEAENLRPCFDQLKEKSQKVFELVSEAAPKSAEEYEALFSTAQAAVGSDLKFQDYSLFYDKSRTWEEMTDMDRVTKPVTLRVLKMKVGEISEPVRDHFGWHVLFLKRFDPEEHRNLSDPQVQLEIGSRILSTVRQSEYTRLIQNAGAQRRVLLHLERLTEIKRNLTSPN